MSIPIRGTGTAVAPHSLAAQSALLTRTAVFGFDPRSDGAVASF